MFLQQAASAAAIGVLAHLPARRLWAAPADALLPEPDEALLRSLALAAMDAARGAGAQFADIRLGAGRSIELIWQYQDVEGGRTALIPPDLRFAVGYGVRAIVDGVWGFAGGCQLTADAVAEAARTAVALARATPRRHPRTMQLAPASRAADGVWETPIEHDPFSVPLGEQRELGLATIAEAARVKGIVDAGCAMRWRRVTYVFASTDGALLVQRLVRAGPDTWTRAQIGEDRWRTATTQVESLGRGGYGYEAIGATTLVAEMRQAAERAVALATAKTKQALIPAAVGRYDLVFGPRAMVGLVTQTVAEAVDLERALGYRANAEGTSFAAPPLEVLGEYRIGSPLLTLRADRTEPHAHATVGWDDEGVKPESYTVIEDGVIVDYHTSRETAGELADWYRRRGEPVRSHGCARGAGQLRPTVHVPNLTMQPGPGTTTLDDLIADTKRGFYIETCGTGVDQQLLSAQGTGEAWEIRNGKLQSAVNDFAFQFIAPQFWKNLDALGGPASARTDAAYTAGRASNDPLQLSYSSVRTVPARVRQVNVLNVGRTA